MSDETTRLAEQYLDAYNRADLDLLDTLIHDRVDLTHHNRGVDVNDKASVMELFRNYGGAFPDKGFSNRRSFVVSGDTAIVQHTWGGTATVDVPGWAGAGEKVSLDLATFLTFRDGLLVEYHDYG